MAAPPSSTIGLARAALTFAEKYKKARGASNPSSLDHGFALLETMAVFRFGCTSTIHSDSVAKLGVFFERTLGRLIDDEEMGWFNEEKRRPFVLGCVNYLAGSADNRAKKLKTDITPAILNLAAADMIVAKRPECPLPPAVVWESKFKILGTACDILSDIIHGELAKESGKKRARLTQSKSNPRRPQTR